MSNQKLQPVLLQPVYFTHIWGGSLLKDAFDKDYGNRQVGESWELSAHDRGNSTVASGIHAGMDFADYYREILGQQDKFPVLIKLIGPQRDLSVQVHPSDDYAQVHENSFGKKEAWVILDAPEGSEIIAGVHCDRDTFRRAVSDGKVQSCLNRIPCVPGDVISINPGMVHALLQDVIVYEVQQNSDITYRLYDWDRIDENTGKGRELHIDKGLDVIDFGAKAEMIKALDQPVQELIDNEYFTLTRVHVNGRWQDFDDRQAAFTVVNGSMTVEWEEQSLFTVIKGQTFYAPSCGQLVISGSGELLKSSF